MKTNIYLNTLLFILITTLFTSCSAIADIFEAGVWTGLIVVIIIAMVIIFIFRAMRK
jgi:hypothetical protein